MQVGIVSVKALKPDRAEASVNLLIIDDFVGKWINWPHMLLYFLSTPRWVYIRSPLSAPIDLCCTALQSCTFNTAVCWRALQAAGISHSCVQYSLPVFIYENQVGIAPIAIKQLLPLPPQCSVNIALVLHMIHYP